MNVLLNDFMCGDLLKHSTKLKLLQQQQPNYSDTCHFSQLNNFIAIHQMNGIELNWRESQKKQNNDQKKRRKKIDEKRKRKHRNKHKK